MQIIAIYSPYHSFKRRKRSQSIYFYTEIVCLMKNPTTVLLFLFSIEKIFIMSPLPELGALVFNILLITILQLSEYNK